MISFAVINLKKIIKNLIKISFIIAFAFGIMNLENVFSNFKKFNYLDVLKNNLCFEEKKDDSPKNFFKSTIVKEIAISEVKQVGSKEEKEVSINIVTNETTKIDTENENNNIIENKIENQNENNDQAVQENIPQNLPTTVISENNIAENYNVTYKSVKIKNETKFNLTEDILTPNVQITDNKNIIIFHTHTCESYTPTEANQYVASGNYRTIDLNHSVAKVGTVLENCLKIKGFNVIHDVNYHDYPAYNGSYDRSFNTVKGLLEKNPTTQFVIDLHRDAVRKHE